IIAFSNLPTSARHSWIYGSYEVLKNFIKKKENGELLIQKTGFFKKNLLKKTDLANSCDGTIHFGDMVMIVSPDNQVNRFGGTHPAHEALSLALNADESRFIKDKRVIGPCAVSACSILYPCIRNTFIITSVDESTEGETLRYGQHFALRTTEEYGGQLYLTSDHKTFQKYAKNSRMQEVNLIDNPTFPGCWKALYLDPEMRLEYEGYPVPANTKILINHCRTNHNLALLYKFFLRTSFGREFEVTTHSFFDSHKVEEDVNHWIILTGHPNIKNGTMLQRSIPVCEEPEPKTEEKIEKKQDPDCIPYKDD
uniref:Cilia and flagella associated protein 161 n=1 Tax=Callorhinchus milii TaxID=7868 RepID=A0A4W3HBY5_CALMI